MNFPESFAWADPFVGQTDCLPAGGAGHCAPEDGEGAADGGAEAAVGGTEAAGGDAEPPTEAAALVDVEAAPAQADTSNKAPEMALRTWTALRMGAPPP
jgi:hypothetical protein